MRTVQIVLNAILSKNIFEYILVDTSLKVLESSSGVARYLGEIPQSGDDILDYIPEFVGNENEIREIFIKKYCLFTLETVQRNDYYINISIEYCDAQTAIVLLHNVTAITLDQQNLLQYSNESTLLYNTLNKVINNQNSLVFVASAEHIEFANKQFLDYFDIKDIARLKKSNLDIYKYLNKDLDNYIDMSEILQNKEEYIKINDDSFLIKSSKIEQTHYLFSMTNINDISKKLNLDPLTGIYRKIYLNDIMSDMISSQKEFALIVLDLDDFKQINDNYGHLVGDEVLKSFVQVVQSKLGIQDVFARWGGEEFLLLTKDTLSLDKKLEDIRKTIQDNHFDIVGHITCSFGATLSKDSDEDKDMILYRADKALYEAKKQGKNQVVIKID
jgi:diguanylate cyclase (GGDEF)-like protein